MGEYTKQFVANVRKERKRRGWSLQKLSDATDGSINRSTLSNYENGRSSQVSVDNAVALAEALDTALVDLLDPLRPRCLTRPWGGQARLEQARKRAEAAIKEFELIKQQLEETY